MKVSDLPARNELPDADDAAEARPRRRRKPVDWPTIAIAVLVAISAALVWRRDGAGGMLEILQHDVALFGGILPRVLAGCLLGAFIAEILPHEKVSKSLRNPSVGGRRRAATAHLRFKAIRWSGSAKSHPATMR